MFCSSLRKRPEWTLLPDILLSLQQQRWQESILDDHDIGIPLPKPNESREHPEQFRFILLSTQELAASGNALERIERLYHQHGGRHVGIVFLLTLNYAGSVAFMELQVSVLSKVAMSILPLSSLASLPTILSAFQRQVITSARSTSAASTISPVSALLPYCSTDPPIPEHARNIVTDICANIPALAQAATTVEGRDVLREYLSDVPSVNREGSAVEGLIAFWEQEFIVD